MVFCFFQKFFSGQHELEYLFFLSRKEQFFFPEFNIRLYDNNSESDYVFFPPPLQVKWSFPYEFLANKYEKLEDTKEVFRKNRQNEKGEKRGQKMKLSIDQYNRDKPMCSRGVSTRE